MKVITQLCTRLSFGCNHLFTHTRPACVCSAVGFFTLISTDKGHKLLQPIKRCASPFCVCAVDFTGKFYRGFHFIPLNISALQSFQPSMYWGCSGA
jgi:hypothetical protein